MTGPAALLAALLLCAQPPASAADVSPAKAKALQLLREGARLYRLGQYDRALARFTAAYVLYPSPKLHFNIGQAQRELDRPVEALTAFNLFLAEPGNAPRPTVEEARRSAAQLRNQLGQIQVECPAFGLEVLLDGTLVGRTPLPGPLWSRPGQRLLALRTRTGVPRAAEPVDVQAGVTRTVTPVLRALDLTPPVLGRAGAASPRPPADPTPSTWSRLSGRWWFWAGVAVVVVGGGVTAAVLLSGDPSTASNQLRPAR